MEQTCFRFASFVSLGALLSVQLFVGCSTTVRGTGTGADEDGSGGRAPGGADGADGGASSDGDGGTTGGGGGKSASGGSEMGGGTGAGGAIGNRCEGVTAEARPTCVTTDDCDEGFECTTHYGISRCLKPCEMKSDCVEYGGESECFESQLGKTYCSIPCNPFTECPCGNSETCDYYSDYQGTVEYTECRPVGAGGNLFPCNANPKLCRAGFTCRFQNGSDLGGGYEDDYYCLPFCDMNPDSELHDCPEPLKCKSTADAIWLGDEILGVCMTD